MSLIKPKYGIENGQIYLAADGSRGGHVVIDAHICADVDEVVVRPFTPNGFGQSRLIDSFKLAKVRYHLVETAPDWMPVE